MPRRDDVPQRSETDSNNPTAQKFNSDFHEQSVIMPQAKENGDAPAAATSALDTYEHAATAGKVSDTGTASYRENNELIDSINSLGLSADHTTAARPDETPWLDYYVQSIKAASEWRGYSRLIEDRPGDMREPQRVEYKAETTIPNRAEDTEAAAVRKGKAVTYYRLTTTPVLAGDLPDAEAYDPAFSYDVSANGGGLNQGTAKVTADNTETLKNAMPHLPEVAEIYPSGPTVPAAVGSDGRTSVEGVTGTTVYHIGPSTMDVGNTDARRSDGLRLPDAAPPRARYASHPNIQPAVRSSAPRPDTDNQPPDTTDRTENNTTAVRSLAPRPWHTTVRLNKKTSWRPRPLCYIGLVTHIILLLLHNRDGGVEPCSPPANTTNQTTYPNITTHYGMANGGAERRSPPTMPTITTVRSPAPRPCHYPNHTVTAAQFSAQELHRRPGIHPVLHVTLLPSHTPHCSRTRNSRNTAFSHRSIPPSQPHPARRCRSVIVSGAGPPVCLPAAGSVKGIKHALHHLTPHLPPPQHQRLFYQGQPLGDHDPTPTTTTTGPIHLTLRLVGLKGGGRR